MHSEKLVTMATKVLFHARNLMERKSFMKKDKRLTKSWKAMNIETSPLCLDLILMKDHIFMGVKYFLKVHLNCTLLFS